MAQGPILLASASTSHDVTDKLYLPPTINEKTYIKVMQNLCFSQESGSSSKKYTKGETSTAQSIGESENVITNQNEAGEELADSKTEIKTVILQEEVAIVTAAPVQSESSLKIEIAKSIVYGGFTELITSLGIVISTSSTNATTGKIVAVSLASLIAGLPVMIYKMSELWINNNETKEDEVESYENIFGDRKNYGVHFRVAILSFIVFGLVSPLVYGFTFRNPENKSLKISTVTLVTVLCIALLAIGNAYIKRASNCVEYVNIIGKSIVDAVGTSLLTTLGGDLIEHYIEQMGWFEPHKIPTLFQPPINFQNATWGAY